MDITYTCSHVAVMKRGGNKDVNLNEVMGVLIEDLEIPVAVINDINNPLYKKINSSKPNKTDEIKFIIITIKYLKTFEA